MTAKFELQHVGYPTASAIPESAWKHLSYHASAMAAYKTIRKHRAHLERGTWDDHYRVIDPTGKIVPMDRLQDEYIEERTRRSLNMD